MKPPSEKGKVRIGAVVDDADAYRFAVMLQPGFAAARWRWSNGDVPSTIPNISRIAATITELLGEVSFEGEWCESGGLGIIVERGLKCLYADQKLYPQRPQISEPETQAGSQPKDNSGERGR